MEVSILTQLPPSVFFKESLYSFQSNYLPSSSWREFSLEEVHFNIIVLVFSTLWYLSSVALALHSKGFYILPFKKALCNAAAAVAFHCHAECIASSACNTLQPVLSW